MSRVCADFSLVISTERTLTDKVRMFQEKCVNLEQALEDANNVSSVEIRALKREITLSKEKNDNLSQAYEELKKGMGYPCFQSSLISETVKFFEEMSDAVNCQAFVDPRLDVFAVQTLVKNAHLETVRLWSNFEAMSDMDSKSTNIFHLKTEVSFTIPNDQCSTRNALCRRKLRNSGNFFEI